MADKNRFKVKVLRTPAEMEQARGIWSAMAGGPESDIDFVSFIINSRPEILRPYVIVIYEGDKPVSLVPGRIERSQFEIKIGYKVVWRTGIVRLVVFYGGLLGQKNSELAEIAVRQLLLGLREEKADLLLWNGVEQGTELGRLLGQIPNMLCADHVSRPVSHWIMTLPKSLEELLEQRMNKKHRHWAKRTLRNLEKDFGKTFQFKRFSAPEEMDQAFNDIIKVAKTTYQWGLGVGFQDNAEQRARLRLEAKNGWHRAYLLYLNGEPAAFWICVVYNGVVYSAFTGYDPQYRKYEIGTALFLHMVGELCRENLGKLDFGLGSAFYKERFGDIEFKESSICVFNCTLRGMVLNGLRTITEGPLNLGRKGLQRFGIENKLKKLWRGRVTPSQGSQNASRPPTNDPPQKLASEA